MATDHLVLYHLCIIVWLGVEPKGLIEKPKWLVYGLFKTYQEEEMGRCRSYESERTILSDLELERTKINVSGWRKHFLALPLFRSPLSFSAVHLSWVFEIFNIKFLKKKLALSHYSYVIYQNIQHRASKCSTWKNLKYNVGAIVATIN